MITLDLPDENDGFKTTLENKVSLDEIVTSIHRSKKIALITGAGISCNAGIPDFRSSDGLYSLAKKKYPKIIFKGKDLFDISLFRNEITLSIFCMFMESIYQNSLRAEPTNTHKFIKILKEKKKLLRCYTQNIDSIEQRADLNLNFENKNFGTLRNFDKFWKSLDVVQLHGNLHKLICTSCFEVFDWSERYQTQLREGVNPKCEKCFILHEKKLFCGKRITNNIGYLRPNIVLYGEDHPYSDLITRGLNQDLKSNPDMLIVIGTSLKIDGIKKLVKSLAYKIHSRNGKVVYINKSSLSLQWNKHIDFQLIGDCDVFVNFLKKEIPDLFLTQKKMNSLNLKKNKINVTKKLIKKSSKKKNILNRKSIINKNQHTTSLTSKF